MYNISMYFNVLPTILQRFFKDLSKRVFYSEKKTHFRNERNDEKLSNDKSS